MGGSIGGFAKGNFTGDGIGGMLGGSALFGNNPLTQKLGLSGEQGEYFTPETMNPALAQLNKRNTFSENPWLNSALTKYGNGSQTFDEALAAPGGKLDGLQKSELRDRMLTDGVTGSKFAAEQIQNGALTKGLFGEGGLQDRLGAEEQDLASRGYQLKPEDREAYGQAAGDISRQFGQQEQDAAKALARRGLGGGSSGAAGATFSGLAGNKNEMLAKAQTDIAQKRMADTTQRLQQTRNLMGSLGTQGAALQDAQFQRQLTGVKNNQQNLTNAAQLNTAANTANNNANLASMEDKRGAKGKTLLEGFGQGLFSSSQQVGAAPGTFVSGMAGAGGSAMGSGMMASDERNKENVRDGSDDIRTFMDSVAPHTYEYSPETKTSLFGGDGEYTSPMAQELEQTPVGDAMVQDTPEGKVVDYGKGFGAVVAGLGDLNKRLSLLEGRK